MTFLARLATLMLGLAIIATVDFPAGAAAQSAPSPYMAVLVAGDDAQPVFDHAMTTLRQGLLARQVSPGDIQQLSAARTRIEKDRLPESNLGTVLKAIAGLRPAEGQTCLVYITSHGAPRRGLFLAPKEEFLTPAALNRALGAGCGQAPTVVIASGCYSGNFARPPLARQNRIILTAARADRPSFGCGTGFDYTVYDLCLLGALERTQTWRDAYAATTACVTGAERKLGFPASGPQASFGAIVSDLAIPRRG